MEAVFAILDFSGPDRVYHRLEMAERLTRRLLASPVTSTPGLTRLALYYYLFTGIFSSTRNPVSPLSTCTTFVDFWNLVLFNSAIILKK